MALWPWAHSNKCIFSFLFQDQAMFHCWKANWGFLQRELWPQIFRPRILQTQFCAFRPHIFRAFWPHIILHVAGAARSAATNLSATYSVLFGHIFRVFWTHIPRVLATYSVLFGHISACFGHILCAFWTHIRLFRPHIPCFSVTYSSACRSWLENGHFQDS